MGLSKNQLLVLSVLLPQPMHPYAIRQEIVELTSHKEWPTKSSVHGALKPLIERGYVQECDSNPHYWLKTIRGSPYELTGHGYWTVRRELSVYYEILIKTRTWLEAIDDKQTQVLN